MVESPVEEKERPDRPEFNALLNVAMSLVTQLHEKLIQWGEQMSDTITEDDVSMIEYFHESYGDITRWTKWEERKPIIAKQYPELIAAIENERIAYRTLDAIVEKIVRTA